ncbi:hypothetical protein [Paraburkholderia tagetis]|uniref:Uncharacterized protein n=1 Tax=Paraburkholderia tagetis TaxID=2913261 RepID=A0A9X1UFS4_9BURK|nr:hypothetical protein [Paraburkholderia tagetis]MCG5072263.1 hypothetical protein [Paraburkholderia tagetis]
MIEMGDLSDAELAKLTEWTRGAFDAAVAAGYVVPPWRPSAGMHDALAGYYRAGLTPSEGAEALFATRQ